MLSLDTRIDLLDRLGEYMISANAEWLEVQHRATITNSWFTPESVSMAVKNIAIAFLQKEKLQAWMKAYIPTTHPKLVGIVMAGNIPLVGFHDFLCGFMSGHNLLLKLSSKDEVLLRHLIQKLAEWEPQVTQQVQTADMLKGCDAYIATGSNNTARYFEQYFAKYPHIIRKNRTSVAILDGTESIDELNELGRDIFTYFGLGCRNVTQLYFPQEYDFANLMAALDNHKDLMLHHKYKNNYDYYLAVYLLNKVQYMTNDSVLLIENEVPFSNVATLHYQYYDDRQKLETQLQQRDDIQCAVGHGLTPFGKAQTPELTDYADGVDTMAFLCSL